MENKTVNKTKIQSRRWFLEGSKCGTYGILYIILAWPLRTEPLFSKKRNPAKILDS